MSKLFRTARNPKVYTGKLKLGPGRWKNVPLFSDKTASERRLKELQTAADRRAAGIDTADTDRLALPIDELAEKYIDWLTVQKKDPDHIRISEWMLNKLIQTGEWRYFRDITRESVEKMLPVLARTASYQNKFIVRAKAFVNWLLPEGCPSPLVKLKRVREKGAKKNRGRRKAAAGELEALFNLDIPIDRKLAYALAALNGFRRSNAEELLWGDLHRDAPIPFVGVRKKNGDDDTLDQIPLHPYVLKLLGDMTPGMPAVHVLRSVPDVETLERDLVRAGFKLSDERGLRLDYHGLRHEFGSRLDLTGCSRATRKKLERRAAQDVTDGYAHAELAEMLAALERLPSPLNDWNRQRQKAVKTGIGGGAVDASAVRDHGRDQAAGFPLHGAALTDTTANSALQPPNLRLPLENQGVDTSRHTPALPDLIGPENRDTVLKTRPSTQVD